MIKIIEKPKQLFIVETQRLILDQFVMADSENICKMAGDIRVSEMTAAIAHPYELDMAKNWIQSHEDDRIQKNNHIYAIRKKDLNLVGAINIAVNSKHDHGCVGYWIGYEFWNQGFCTEALNAILELGFRRLTLHKVWAEHKTKNVASGRVMEKVGMIHEGIKREHFKSGVDYQDMSIKSILANEYINRKFIKR